MARASDDFYPTDRASHRPHILACSYNSLFISPLALPDWWARQAGWALTRVSAEPGCTCSGSICMLVHL